MKPIFFILLLALPLLSFAQTIAQMAKDSGQFPELVKTPPMGWNSWNAFGLDINSKIVMLVADAMVTKGMKDAGYEYIVIDDGWQIDRNENGRIVADSTRFPEGIKFLADYVHSKGLKFGIYTCSGTKTCGGRPGSYGHEAIDAQTYADWGVDFVKVDWCFTDGLDTRTQYKIMSDAIRATGRPMILSICEWGTTSPWEWGKDIGAMWRTTSDIQDCFDCVRDWGGMGWVPILEKNVNLAPFAGPGHWNDPDMLEVGNKALTPTECRAHFAMWCMLAAPLMAGNNVNTMSDTIRDILTAPEIIAINQDPLGIQGTRIRNNNGLQVWQKPLSDGSVAVSLLNLTKSPAQMDVTLEEIGFKKGVKSSVRDLWKRKDLPAIKDIFTVEVESHGVVVVKIKGKKAPVSVLEFDQPSITLNKGNNKLVHINVLPSVIPVTVTSSDEGGLNLTIAGVNTYRLSARKEGKYIVKATASDGKKIAVSNVTVIPSNIPFPWKFNDIKDDKSSAVYENGVFSIESAGADIWGGRDQFAFVNMEVSGDSYISARIISQANTDPWAKSGVMMRESFAPNSAFAMLCTTPGNGISLQWRESTGESCKKMDFTAIMLPVYLKLSKNGSTFKAYQSTDGKQWDLLGEASLNNSFDHPYLVGLEVASHSTQMLNLSRFDQVKGEPKVMKKNLVRLNFAQNPIIQTVYTADPAPMVYNGKVYVYTSHDEDETVNNFFTMLDWRCYSSSDMVNWTDHGSVASLKDFGWSDKTNGAWAPQCIERNGKFYLYCPVHGDGIGVLVSDSPTGPFKDILGKRLVDSDHIWNDIDPTVFVDDNGQAYLYWGNPTLYYVKLNDNMISYDRSIGKNGIVSAEMATESFGKNKAQDGKHLTNYTEGPWIYKRKNLYYMVYAAAGIPEYIAYSTAPSATGPWTYRGIIMGRHPGLAFTNHPGIVDFKGNSYFFYHNQGLPGGEGFRRSVCVEQFKYNADGSIPLITPTKEGVKKSVSNLNPFQRVEAETIAWSEGLKTAYDRKTGVYVTKINNGGHIKVRSVDFGKGAKKFEASVASASAGGGIEIRLDGVDGTLLGVCEIKNTGGRLNWELKSVKVKRAKGIHDLYFVFKGGKGELFNFDWWRFK
jgi:arabinoxylan arabinofuranohydrolase